MRKLYGLLLAALLAFPVTAPAAMSAEDLQKRLDELVEEIDYLNERVDKNEVHAATDRITFTGDLRTKADTLHYQDAAWNPAVKLDFTDFINKVMSNPGAWGYSFGGDGTPGTADDSIVAGTPLGDLAATYGLTPASLGMFSGVMDFPLIPGMMMQQPEKYDINNDIAYSTRLRLDMKAKVYKNVGFSGRLTMYKGWGDSTGTKVFDSWNAFTMDGTNGGNTTGDWLRVERAYFNWKNIGGTPFYFSVGRRPSTYGPPSQYRENEKRGGTPSGHLVHFNFDGMTLGYDLGDVLEGMKVRFCYGQGYESERGNGELFNHTATRDTHLGGFNIDVINDGTNFIQLTAFRAEDVVDGFNGTFAFPTQLAQIFAPTMYKDMQKFPTFNFVTRYQPSQVIGDMTLGGIGLAREEMNGVNYFGSFGWTQLDSNGRAGMFGGMGNDAVFEAELSSDGSEIILVPTRATDADTENGYGIYVGVQVPAPAGKFGLEYNHGSKYWTPFTQGQDDMLGSKLAVRGDVYEAYYIAEINPRMFVKLAGLYYDYDYTGSGSPVGEPVKISDVHDGSAYNMLPVVDTAWNANLSLTVNF